MKKFQKPMETKQMVMQMAMNEQKRLKKPRIKKMMMVKEQRKMREW
jgi:hypothetical protein